MVILDLGTACFLVSDPLSCMARCAWGIVPFPFIAFSILTIQGSVNAFILLLIEVQETLRSLCMSSARPTIKFILLCLFLFDIY